MLLGLGKILHAAVERQQVRVGVDQRRIGKQGGLVVGDRLVDLAGFGEPHAALQHRARVLAQGGDRVEHWIVQARPSCSVAGVLLERARGFFRSAERAIRARQPVVGRPELGKCRDRSLEVLDGRLRLALLRRDAAEPDVRRRLSRGFLQQRVEQLAALDEVA